ncbi:Tetratricopeptide repeat 12, partial [Brachionus plicatilis]
INDLWNQATRFLIFASDQSKDKEILFNVLICLLNNVCAFKSKQLETNIQKIVDNITKGSQCQNQKVLSLVSNVIQNMDSKEMIVDLFKKNFVENLIKNVKTKTAMNQSVKILALFTQNNSKNFRKMIIQIDKNLEFLYQIFKDVSQTPDQPNTGNKILNLKKLNEVAISNAVLCMSNCVESDDKLAERLLKTDIIMDLLYLTRDGYNIDLQKNCGILIAKLAKKDQRHLLRLRELNGVEILYAALKNTNI